MGWKFLVWNFRKWWYARLSSFLLQKMLFHSIFHCKFTDIETRIFCWMESAPDLPISLIIAVTLLHQCNKIYVSVSRMLVNAIKKENNKYCHSFHSFQISILEPHALPIRDLFFIFNVFSFFFSFSGGSLVILCCNDSDVVRYSCQMMLQCSWFNCRGPVFF